MLFPWPGFFEQLLVADVLIWLDDVLFSKGSFTNRVQIPLGADCKWLTIPLERSGFGCRIIDLRAADEHWRDRHLGFLRQAYRRAPSTDDALHLVKDAYSHDTIADLIIASAERPAEYLGVLNKFVRLRSSDLGLKSHSSRRVLELVKAMGGSRYVTGHGAANYLDHGVFEREGVTVEYMDYSQTPWPQAEQPFNPYVSVLDLIANTGRQASSYLHPKTIGWREFLREKGAVA
jgi:hypothetical protein